MCRHEIDGFRSHPPRGHDEVAFVLTISGVHLWLSLPYCGHNATWVGEDVVDVGDDVMLVGADVGADVEAAWQHNSEWHVNGFRNSN